MYSIFQDLSRRSIETGLRRGSNSLNLDTDHKNYDLMLNLKRWMIHKFRPRILLSIFYFRIDDDNDSNDAQPPPGFKYVFAIVTRPYSCWEGGGLWGLAPPWISEIYC